MQQMERNVFIRAKSIEGRPGFAVFLIFSGTEERVCMHRHDGLLYRALEDGVRLEEFRRWHPRPLRGEHGKTRSSVRACTRIIESKARLLAEVDTYLKTRRKLAAGRVGRNGTRCSGMAQKQYRHAKANTGR